MSVEQTHIPGSATDDVIVYLPEDQIEESLYDQVQEMADAEAFEGGKIRIMPDGHWGKGAAIGFTMPMSGRAVPNTVGKDIGCGVYASRLSANPKIWENKETVYRLDEEIRESVPMGRNVHGWNRDYHLVNQFPWDVCENKLSTLEENLSVSIRDYVDFFDGYGGDYLNELCERVHYDVDRAIESLGTLGGGNHFIEFGTDSNDDVWVVIHSGSRGIGATIADYWQEEAKKAQDERATELREALSDYSEEYFHFDLYDVGDRDLINWVQGGMGEDWKDMDTIEEKYSDTNPTRIEELHGELTDIAREITQQEKDDQELAYLEGEDVYGYYIDMIFAQTYAEENRRKMADYTIDSMESVLEQSVTVDKTIHSIHNYIDFEDTVIRKGATRAYEGEEFVIPLNMADGVIIAEGKGNSNWNNTGPHGSGRALGRREADETLNEKEVAAALEHIDATEIPMDEAPQAYKDAAMIKEAIEPTAEVKDTIKVLHNLKAPE